MYSVSPYTTGETLYGPAFNCAQAIDEFVVSLFLSDMSPDAPGLMAKTGLNALNTYPDVTYSNPCAEKGVGITIVDIPPSSHKSLPSRLYERTRFLPQVTSSVRSPFSQMYGVAQF